MTDAASRQALHQPLGDGDLAGQPAALQPQSPATIEERSAASSAAAETGPVFFETGAQFRQWLDEHHAAVRELVVGYWKVGTGIPSMTWSDSVDAALCYGWIDGVRRRLNDQAYTIRFTPRRIGSIWSAVNVAKVEALTADGQMTDAGLAAYAARRDDRTAIYSHEQGADESLSAEEQARLRESPEALLFFEAQPASYQRAVAHWLHTAKREQTRARRLDLLVTESAASRRVAPFKAR
jgi:uncharacterized protein YdeI (YjbR/CyaY-like superfamily)